MNQFSANCADIATSATSGTFRTFIAIKAANTAGYRGRLIELSIVPAGEVPQDINADIQISRSDNTTDGTGTAQTPSQIDNGSRASIMTVLTACTLVTGEPTAIAAVPIKQYAMNGRGNGFWIYDINSSPKWGVNQALLIRIAQNVSTAIKFSVNATWEEF